MASFYFSRSENEVVQLVSVKAAFLKTLAMLCVSPGHLLYL